MIRLNAEEKLQFRQLFIEAVALQMKLFDKLGEIEGVTGMVTGLDDAVRGEASNYSDLAPTLDQFPVKDANIILQDLEREK